MKRTTKKMPRNLLKLKPIEFENLTFDLMVAKGMVNVVWRTRGADGGRDIEASVLHIDFSGLQTSTKWFVECKRYKGSIGWPTIYEKLAYADSLQADYLLLCTTSQFTPAAINQVELWNRASRTPKIRLWPGQELNLQLKQYPDILLKYGLLPTPATPGKSLVSLSLALSKSVGSYHSQLIFENSKKIHPMLQAAQTLGELILRRMEDLAESGRIRPSFAIFEANALTQCLVSGVSDAIDEIGLRAFASYLIALTRASITVTFDAKGSCRIVAQKDVTDLLFRYRDTFSAIAFWSDFEFSFSEKTIFINQRL